MSAVAHGPPVRIITSGNVFDIMSEQNAYLQFDVFCLLMYVFFHIIVWYFKFSKGWELGIEEISSNVHLNHIICIIFITWIQFLYC